MIYCRDCFLVIKLLPDQSIDHLVTDLPYFGVVKDLWDNQWSSELDYMLWVKNFLISVNRVLKDDANVIIFTGRQYNRLLSLHNVFRI